MDYKVVLRKYNGHWFMGVGTKGYACTTEFEKFLDEVRPSCIYISDRFLDPWFIVKVSRETDVITEFLEPTTGKLYSMKQCPKMFEDLNLPTQFYINRGNS